MHSKKIVVFRQNSAKALKTLIKFTGWNYGYTLTNSVLRAGTKMNTDNDNFLGRKPGLGGSINVVWR